MSINCEVWPRQATKRTGKNGGERTAVQTLREVRGRLRFAPAFGVRWL